MKKLNEGVQAVLNGSLSEFEMKHVHPAMIGQYMTNEGFEQSELETNGWDYDWWLEFTKDGKSYTASGSGYYGKFSFAPTED